MKKRSKRNSLASYKKKLWKVFSQYIKLRDGPQCFVCGKTGLKGQNWHVGHCIPKAAGGLLLYFHEQNNHSCCYFCNINLGGNGAVYNQRIREVYGNEMMDELLRLRGRVVKWTREDYEDLIAEYKRLIFITKSHQS